MTPLALTTSARHFPAVARYWKEFLALGVFAALTTLSQGKAYTLTLSSYVEAVKQIEILFAMGVGVLFFGEAQRVRESALGGLVMLAGMVLLALAPLAYRILGIGTPLPRSLELRMADPASL